MRFISTRRLLVIASIQVQVETRFGPGIWSSDRLPEHSYCAKLAVFETNHEHLIRFLPRCEHIWCLWKVRCGPKILSMRRNEREGFLFPGLSARTIFDVVFAAFVISASLPVLQNMASKKQKQNKYFEPFRLVNSYGKFGRSELFHVWLHG